MRRARLSDDLAGVEIENDRFDALGAGIDANEKTHGWEAELSSRVRGVRG